MFDYYKGNARSIQSLQNWVEQKKGTGLLLSGTKGLGLKSLALKAAGKVLCLKNTQNNCDCQSCKYSLLSHPDFLLIEPIEGESKIGVDKASEILKKATLKPAVASNIVVVIVGMDCMTVQAQNKLLKLLEDNESLIVIGVLYSDNILDTIKSRMLTLEFTALNKDEFKLFVDSEEGSILYESSKGCPGAIQSIMPMLETLKRLLTAIVEKELRDFIPILHLMQEKDKENFAVVHKKELPYLLNFLEFCFMEIYRFLCTGERSNIVFPEVVYEKQEVIDRLQLINEEKQNIRLLSYTKDDFFVFVVKMI